MADAIERYLYHPSISLFKLLIVILFLFAGILPVEAQSGASYGTGKAEGTIAACAGMASVSPNIQQFSVWANNLTTQMSISAPTYFELSLSPLSGYSGSVSINPVNGTIDNVIIYARTASYAPAGSISSPCILSVAGQNTFAPILSATVYSLPTINPVPNQVLLSGMATQAINFTGTGGNTYTWTNDTPSIGLGAAGDGNIASFTAINNSSSPVTANISVTAVVAGFAYIPNSADGTISVMNTLTNKVAGTIPVGSQPYGIALTGSGSTAFITNYGSGTVSVVDTKTNTVTHTINVGSGPAGLALTPDSAIFLVNENDNTIEQLNPVNYTVAGTRTVGLAPVNVLCSLDGTEIFVANSGSNDITVLNVFMTTLAIIPVGLHPDGMALSLDGNTLYVANTIDNSISLISTINNTVTTTISLGGSGGPAGMVINGDGTLLYVTNPASGTVSVVNTTTRTVEATIPVGQGPEGIDLSDDGSTLYVVNNGSNTVSVISTATNTVSAVVPVGAAPVGVGKFLKRASGCESATSKFTITVNPVTFPTITPGGAPAALTTVYGTASAATAFTVAGANMTAGIQVTPPTGFEVSTDDINFSSNVTIGSAGNIAVSPVYIRLASITPVGTYTGNIVLSSAPAESVDIMMPQSTVTPAPLTIIADNKSRLFDSPNPALTASYSGFVNNDTPADLTSMPQLTTTALITSPPGQYPITIAGAMSPNYAITYVSGLLTVTPPLFIPNTFTPNGDGINDKWEIDRLSGFANCRVTVFSRYGQPVYASTGYSIPWNGTYNGTVLPTGTYYYLIDLKNGGPLLSGFVMIVR